MPRPRALEVYCESRAATPWERRPAAMGPGRAAAAFAITAARRDAATTWGYPWRGDLPGRTALPKSILKSLQQQAESTNDLQGFKHCIRRGNPFAGNQVRRKSRCPSDLAGVRDIDEQHWQFFCREDGEPVMVATAPPEQQER